MREPEFRCCHCGDVAEGRCAWMIGRGRHVPEPVDPAIPLGLQRGPWLPAPCLAPVCYRHLRDVGGGKLYCIDHWSTWLAEPGRSSWSAALPEWVVQWADAHPGQKPPAEVARQLKRFADAHLPGE